MEASEIIRKSVDTVSALRQETSKRPKLLAATKAIKCFQSRRFENTYQDLLLSPEFSAPAHFFYVNSTAIRTSHRVMRSLLELPVPLKPCFPSKWSQPQ
jgi:hypothetical protein